MCQIISPIEANARQSNSILAHSVGGDIRTTLMFKAILRWFNVFPADFNVPGALLDTRAGALRPQTGRADLCLLAGVRAQCEESLYLFAAVCCKVRLRLYSLGCGTIAHALVHGSARWKGKGNNPNCAIVRDSANEFVYFTDTYKNAGTCVDSHTRIRTNVVEGDAWCISV